MTALNRIIETILPDFLRFLEEQERLKNSEKELDNNLFQGVNDYDEDERSL